MTDDENATVDAPKPLNSTFNVVYGVNDAELTVKYTGTAPVIRINSVVQTPTVVAAPFLIFRNVVWGTVTGSGITTFIISAPFTYVDIPDNTVTTWNYGDPFLVLYTNEYHNVDANWRFNGSVVFALDQPPIAFDVHPDVFVIRISNPNYLKFTINNTTNTGVNFTGDCNKHQSFIIGDFHFQLYCSNGSSLTNGKHTITDITAPFLYIGHLGVGPNKNYTYAAFIQGETPVPTVTVPQDTIPSFTQALTTTDGIEFGVILSKDYVPVVTEGWHIPRLGYVPDNTWDEISEVPIQPGVYRPNLTNVLTTFPTAVKIIDVKYPSKYGEHGWEGLDYFRRVDVLYQLIKDLAAYKAQPIILAAFDPGVAVLLKNMQNVFPVFLLHNGLNLPDQTVALVDSRYSVIEWNITQGVDIVTDHSLAGFITNVGVALSRPADILAALGAGVNVMTWGNFYGTVIETAERTRPLFGLLYDDTTLIP